MCYARTGGRSARARGRGRTHVLVNGGARTPAHAGLSRCKHLTLRALLLVLALPRPRPLPRHAGGILIAALRLRRGRRRGAGVRVAYPLAFLTGRRLRSRLELASRRNSVCAGGSSRWAAYGAERLRRAVYAATGPPIGHASFCT